MTNAHALAQLAVEVWKASGERTENRLRNLVNEYAQSYFGPMAGWRTEIIEMVHDAKGRAQAQIQPWQWQ